MFGVSNYTKSMNYQLITCLSRHNWFLINIDVQGDVICNYEVNAEIGEL